jgi:hypothetical protein
MSNEQWISLKKNAAEGTPATIAVQQSGMLTLQSMSRDQGGRVSTRVEYTSIGGWKGTFTSAETQYDTFRLPKSSVASAEGLPAIPQRGIYVAIPEGATAIEAKVIRKRMEAQPGKWHLQPAPKPLTESEYLDGKEEYRPDPRVYDSDEEYPSKDFEFVGVRRLEGVRVVHLIVYLAQFRPLSGRLSLVKSLTIEISYDVPPATDAASSESAVRPSLADMILDLPDLPASRDVAGSTIDLATDDRMTDEPDASIGERVKAIMGSVIRESPFSSLPKAQVELVLKRSDIECEYVIITPDALSAAVEPLRLVKQGAPQCARIATTQRILFEFPAADLKESIRSFLTWSWTNWRRRPRYAVLAGDVDVIPIHIWGFGNETYASDHYYADINDDLSQEIIVSRIPTSDASTMRQICDHLAEYPAQRGPDWGRRKNEALLIAYEAPTYKGCCDTIAEMIGQRFRVTKCYGDATKKQDVIDEMNDGVLIVNYRGHGSQTGWSSANGLDIADIRQLNNGTMPPMVLCVCCLNAEVDDQSTEAVVETFVKSEKCVAILGASRKSFTDANNDFDQYLWQAIMDGRAVTPGDIVNRAKALMVQNYSDDYHWKNVVMYMLFGDPSAKVTSAADFLLGTWDISFARYKGTLEVNSMEPQMLRTDLGAYPTWRFQGSYTDASAAGHPFIVKGTLGGEDANSPEPSDKRADHMIGFTVAFPNRRQRFSGYVATPAPVAMAGDTKRSNKQYRWSAQKR